MEDLTFGWNGLTLAGTVHYPAAEGVPPIVLMLQGSGPTDRTSNGYFDPIRRTFLQRGIATFAFDKPGCGHSTGNWRRHGLEDRADQAVAAIDLLRDHGAIDSDRLGVWGQSQGGWLAQMLAARIPDLAFAIANSGPTIGVAEQNLYGCEHTLRHQGFTESDIRAALSFVDGVHGAARDGEAFESIDARLLNAARQQPWYQYLIIDDADDWAEACLWATETYDPPVSLARITCPFLAVYGGLDVLVPPWRGASETGGALQAAGNADATVVVFPTGDHRIQDPASESGAFVPGYLDLLGDWAARRAGTASGGT